MGRPDGWKGEEPVVTVFNHDSWSNRIKHLVNEILEIERRLTSTVDPASPNNFELHNLDYTREEVDEDGDFVTGRVKISKSSLFKTPANLVIVDAKPERTFVRELTNTDNAQKVDAWLKSTPVGFYWIEYAWKKGNTPKRGEFSPDFFIKQGGQIFVVEVKGDEEIAYPSADNIKKHEYATDHFKRLNQWLEKAKIPTRYQFNMIAPKSYNVFFQKLRDGGVVGFRSDLDVAMTKAAKSGS